MTTEPDKFFNLMVGLADIEMSISDEQINGEMLVEAIEAATLEQPPVGYTIMSNIRGYEWTLENIALHGADASRIASQFGYAERMFDLGRNKRLLPRHDGDPQVMLIPLGNGDVFRRVFNDPLPSEAPTYVEGHRRQEYLGITYRADQVQFSRLPNWLKVLSTHRQVHWDLYGGVVHRCQYCELGSQAYNLPLNCIKFVLMGLRRANTTTQELIEKWIDGKTEFGSWMDSRSKDQLSQMIDMMGQTTSNPKITLP